MVRRIVVAAALACGIAQAAPGERLLDDFSDPSAWSVEASEGVHASLQAERGPHGDALCLDYDFGDVSGYAIARRRLEVEWPRDFAMTFGLRGEGGPDDLQVKLVDASGENVWWRPMPRTRFAATWTPVRVLKREVSFAWGPAADHALTHTATLELAVARGGGRKGRACFDRLALRARDVEPVGAPIEAGPWSSDASAADGATRTIDLGRVREIGGLVLHWLPGHSATRFDVETSEDGAEWTAARHVTAGGGGVQPIRLGAIDARFVRLRMLQGPTPGFALSATEVRGAGFGETPNAFFAALAREAPRGRYPRAFCGEQSYWTVVGVDGGSAQALLSEDGALEARAGEAALEPMLLTDQGLVTWSDVKATHSLAEGSLPIPTVSWRRGDLELRTTALGTGDRAHAQVIARYTVVNHAAHAHAVTLVLALRPFQVNPPSQFLNTAGGAAVMHELAWNGRALAIDGEPRFHALRAPDSAFVVPLDAGNVTDLIAAGRRDGPHEVHDETGFPSAALFYRLDLPAHGERSIGVVAPLAGTPELPRGDATAWMQAQEKAAIEAWRSRLDRVAVRLPPQAQALAHTLRSALAYILIERSGAALQPGTRSYARSWIRDGALMSDALLRMGQAAPVREFADWYSAHLFASGRVPCCVDARGADPVPENDSAGEWLHLVDRYFRYTRDEPWLRAKWPDVDRVASFMESLRSREAGPYHGLVAPSISHEGYSDRPAWSYWDDFWTLAGYDAAVHIASQLQHEERAHELASGRESFRRDLRASIDASMAAHGIDFIPGSADRGDFDATSTTVALSPADARDSVPPRALEATFERYWKEFLERRDGKRPWDAYTPYEWRNVGAFVRLGWRERAQALVDFFMADRRPRGWNQWAEVVGRDPRAPRFVGDMPHAWVEADFIRSVLDLLVYERPHDRALVLAAGVPRAWLDDGGVAVERLRTPWGLLGYGLRREGAMMVLTVAAGSAVPPGGLVLALPWEGGEACAQVHGAQRVDGEWRVMRAPARVEVKRRAECARAASPAGR